ncbi:cytochrome P450 [Streptomyces sp. NPDC007984]|uniref:cytochrome P450 n=1 Tax=Streptomyces sp. NPDC007984 TaxID=3364801 RepID=UPI0036E704F3
MPNVTTPPYDRRIGVPLLSRLRTERGQQDPFPVYARLRSEGAVVPAPWGGFLVTRFDLCDEALRSGAWLEPDRHWRERQGPSARWLAPSAREMSGTLPALNPPEHAMVRRTAGAFDRGTVERMSESVTRVTDGLLDTLADRLRRDGEADFVALVGEELPLATIGDWLALPSADRPRLRELTHEQVFAQELLPSASQLARSDAATAELRTYFMELVRERRAHRGEDPVSRWISTWDGLEPDQDKADEAVYYLALFVLLASLETTSTLLSTMTLLLAERPERWNLVAARPDLASAFVEETLRFDPPTHVISRVAAADCTLGGVSVRADETIHLMVGAAHRDPARYRDADRFDPLRTRPAHLAFSSGIHYCLGAPLARLEARILLRRLVVRLPRLTVVRRPTMAPRVAFRRPLNLDVAFA